MSSAKLEGISPRYESQKFCNDVVSVVLFEYKFFFFLRWRILEGLEGRRTSKMKGLLKVRHGSQPREPNLAGLLVLGHSGTLNAVTDVYVSTGVLFGRKTTEF